MFCPGACVCIVVCIQYPSPLTEGRLTRNFFAMYMPPSSKSPRNSTSKHGPYCYQVALVHRLGYSAAPAAKPYFARRSSFFEAFYLVVWCWNSHQDCEKGRIRCNAPWAQFLPPNFKFLTSEYTRMHVYIFIGAGFLTHGMISCVSWMFLMNMPVPPKRKQYRWVSCTAV